MSMFFLQNARILLKRRGQSPGAFAATLGLALAGILPWLTAQAQECSIETMGERVYERVKQRIEEKFSTKDQFSIAPYAKAEIELEPDCNFSIHGRFQFSIKNQLNRKTYDAKLAPKDNAPGGLQILSFDIHNG
ncbi:MAG TPA: hypothetical protein VLA52_01425 [Thermohalobaculum sp.]|nr:hypothetical protein [Thermohalobaculum sp.]